MTKAFDLALFVGTPVNPGDGVVVNTIGPPLNTKFAPMVSAPVPGVVVGASVPAATAPGQSLISGAGPSFGWGVGIPSGGGGGIADAPSDGTAYARKSLGWAQITHGDIQDWSGATAGFRYTLPTASTSVLGGVKVDGSTITISGGVISSSGGSGGGSSTITAGSTPTSGFTAGQVLMSDGADVQPGGPSVVQQWGTASWPLYVGGFNQYPQSLWIAGRADAPGAYGLGINVFPGDSTAGININNGTSREGYFGFAFSNNFVNTASETAFMSHAPGLAEFLDHALPTTACAVRAYNTRTDANNGEWGALDWQTVAGTLTIGAQANGTGVLRPVNIVGSTVTVNGSPISGGSGGIGDAPNDGTSYARKSLSWSHITHADITDWASALSGYALTTSVPGASSTAPAMDGTAAAGAGVTWSRGDHVHPTDTSRYAATNPSGYQTAAQVTAALPVASSTTPAMNGTAAVGTGTTWARADHVHPVDTSRYAATNPSGFQTAAQVSSAITAAAYTLPTASTSVLGGVKVDGSTITVSGGVISSAGGGGGIADAPNDGTSYARKSAAWAHLTHSDLTDWATATASFTYTLPNATTTVLGGVKVDGTTITAASGVISAVQPTVPGPSGVAPVMNGTAAAGSSALWSRGDHVHPTDTSRYAAANPSGYQTAAQVSSAITAAAYTLPTASTSVLGGVMVDGTTVTISAGKISSSGGAAPSSTTPAMDGTAAIGTGTTYARADHVHPSDTSRYAATNPSGFQTAANVTASLAPYALIASPTFTGVVTIPTGAAIATPNIMGVVNASNAAAGQVGEFITASQLTAQSLTTATAINLASISLTAGDWDVDGDVFYQASALAVSNFVCGVGLTSLTIPAVGTPGRAQIVGAATAFVQSSFSTGRLRVNVSTTTTVYLVASATFGSGTCTAQGTIQARRMR